MSVSYQSTLKTGMAQRQRAGLITLRSQDRNLLPVYLFFIILSNFKII